MTLPRIRLVAAVLFLALAAAACGGAVGESESAASEAVTTFEGEFSTLGGGSVDLADFEGQDVVLWFWAPW